jgi:hypothetical protein
MKIFTLIVVLVFAIAPLNGQKVKWQKKKSSGKTQLHLFHSTHGINLPTAETMQQGDFEFEVSHRFLSTVDQGFNTFWGMDGGAHMRLALGYAITNDLMVTLGRSDVNVNWDLRAKYRILQLNNKVLPMLFAIQAGSAYNQADIPQLCDGSKLADDKTQFYGQFIANTMYQKTFGIGVVASYLHNSHPACKDTQHSITLGTNVQYYVSDTWSLLAEWNPTVDGWRNKYDTIAFGFELETGGHFFKMFLTNNVFLNPAQYLAGADVESKWRFGFNITRAL